ncbi:MULTISPECIES: hypothetical protein [unclassified Luteococcus]|uniref:hypothetical protein n=1 Tax=unclassified Luteococcus TaxID=2639923 RepID=UPI00313CDA46
MAGAKLIEQVVHGGVIYAAGTARADAQDVPTGPWWSEPVTDTKPEAADEPVTDTKPDESWKNDDIKAYAESHGIDLGEAKTKADMLAAIND